MIWPLFAVMSAFLLGFYDLLKKKSLTGNAVIPVLFFSTLSGAILFTLLFLISRLSGNTVTSGLLYIPVSPLKDHLYFFIKSIIVGSSWILAYFAFKHLPITIATPIRASAPIWTLLGAFLIFQERLTGMQWFGISVTMFFYLLLSFEGKKEGLNFRNNKWILFMAASTMLGSISSLYDKYLINHFNRMAVQAYSTMYIALMFLPVLLFIWYPNRKNTTPFQWRFAIPMIGLCLAAADFAYFYALSMPHSLISIVSIIRRGSVVVAFTWGYFIYKEKNFKRKAIVLSGILIGLVLIILGSK